MTCDAAIRQFPVPGVELRCAHDDRDHTQHSAMLRDYAYPGSATKVEWRESDRRNYHGEWPGSCTGSPACILPMGHSGDHTIMS